MKNVAIDVVRSTAIPVLALTLIVTFSGTSRAQIINFGPAQQITSDSNVINENEVYGYSLTRDQGGTLTVNGATFAQVGNGGNGNYNTANFSMTTTSGVNSSQNSGTFGAAAAPFNTLSTNFQTVLSAGDEGQPGVLSFTLNNLVAGNTYVLEVFSNDSRGFTANRFVTLSDTVGGTGVALNNDTTGSGGLGQYTIGNFTATGTTATFLANTGLSTGLVDAFVLDNPTGTTYNLTTTAATSRLISGQSTSLTTTITNTGTGSADALNFTGLGASATTVSGPTTSGGPLPNAGGTASNTGQTFSDTTTGAHTLSPTVGTTTNALLGSSATAGGNDASDGGCGDESSSDGQRG